ncbi:MAG TPA: selenocysteine-specific translation elongation factor [Gemmatimonadales bacterium]|nr:selenocysteine-specific translation elongation factor [Gemmatimonadales bacterium]
MIVGTAGHIDHGKSALVAALTGRPMDRLAEEQRRGITIDLNFAPLDLGSRGVAGVVDVPGHEDFVRTVVAGASGIDLALLIVAADEGPMPQTIEHLAILEHLGVPAGIPVVTKADLVDGDWLALVLAELSEWLARSPVAFDPPLAVSARTGFGVEELRARLVARAAGLAPRSGGDLFRMPVDRVFSVAGVGTVVTGTAWSGRIGVGETALMLPAGITARVRSIESHDRALEESQAGARTAVGLAGLEREQARRGTWLVAAGDAWRPTGALDTELGVGMDAPRPVAPRSRVRVLIGTAEILARVQASEPIRPGERGVARLVLESPVIARAGDRFVIRSYSPVATIGGGRVLDPQPPRRREPWPAGLTSELPAERFAALLERRPWGIAAEELPILLGVPGPHATAVAHASPLATLVGDRWVKFTTLRRIGERALASLKTFHRAQPSERGIPLETLRHGLRAPEAVVERALNDLAAAGRIRRADGLAMLSGFTPRVEGGDAEIDRIIRILEEADLSPPSLLELELRTGRRDIAAILRLAARTGRVEAVGRERYYARAPLERFTEALGELGRHGMIAPGAIRDRFGISRKYMIPLLEWADAKGITERIGEGRRLRNA